MRARFLLVLFLFSMSCSRSAMYEYDGEPNSYAQASYMHKVEQKSNALRPEFDVPIKEPVDLSACDPSHWERKPYETIDQWHDRIHYELCSTRDELVELRKKVQESVAYEAALAKQAQELVAQNERLRQRRSELIEEAVATVTFKRVSEVPPHFHVHLVRKGETLYSIAVNYYGDPDMVSRILSWNQGWLRGPENLVAGVGLVLFPASYQGSAQEEVTAYLRKLENSLKGSYSR